MIARIGPEYAGLVAALAQRRRELGMSQLDLDEKIGTTDGQVAKWESAARRPSPFLLLCWVSALGMCLGLFLQPARELAAASDPANTAPNPVALTGTASRPRPKARAIAA